MYALRVGWAKRSVPTNVTWATALPVTHPYGSPRGAETALPPRRGLERFHAFDLDMGHRRNHELGDAVAPANGKCVGPEIDQQHHDLAAVIGVDRAGAVQERQPVLQRKPRARDAIVPRTLRAVRARSPWARAHAFRAEARAAPSQEPRPRYRDRPRPWSGRREAAAPARAAGAGRGAGRFALTAAARSFGGRFAVRQRFGGAGENARGRLVLAERRPILDAGSP